MNKLNDKCNEIKKEIVEIIDRKIDELKENFVDLTPEEEKRATEYRNRSKLDVGDLENHLDKISNDVFKNYLPQISTSYYCDGGEAKFDSEKRVRVLPLSMLTIDIDEKSIEKLQNVYSVLVGENCSFALKFERTTEKTVVNYVVVNQENDEPDRTNSLSDNLKASFLGNFPGAIFEKTTSYCVNEADKSKLNIAMITNVATEKSEDFLVQTIEKMLDGYIPTRKDENYSIILLAVPKSHKELNELKNLYANYYTAISPFATWQQSSTFTEALSLTKNISGGGGITVGIPHIVSATANINVGSAKGSTLSGTEGLTLTHTLFKVKNTMERIEAQIKRLESCEALGMWDFAAYVLSEDYVTTKNVASMYQALMQGDESFLEKSATNTWHYTEKEVVANIFSQLSCFRHPRFTLKNSSLSLPEKVCGSTCISGKELARAMSLPKKSISGLPVITCAEFGRNITLRDGSSYTNQISLGHVYHMQKEELAKVMLDRQSLTSHTFITGSTGSGKSNTIYQILNELEDTGAKFLVIEPAKGEYKSVFGGRKDVSVYSTNPNKATLLKLNPFSFPHEVHVLEHIDRLVEIFNACWPMYAAMPAILKDAIVDVYEKKGWDMKLSCSATHIFPTFKDLLIQLPMTINKSQYSKDTQSDYVGALVTRVKSLTTGIYGMVFCADSEISDKELFENNVIADLSRVGSMETKSLLMGILIMKLQEYRMSTGNINAELKHITVLEEAHNLLRRTSPEQSQDSSNLQGKSVEMLANAIAEMRTYGEGFIIADQSPGLLDMSVIRNTNTKIIMRLPDESDRMLVGKAAGLNDNQIIELAKLRIGVAAVFQNNWVEPVLCAVEQFSKNKECSYIFENIERELANAIKVFMGQIIRPEQKGNDLSSEQVEKINKWIDSLNIGTQTKKLLKKAQSDALSEKEQGIVAYNLFGGKEVSQKLAQCDDIGEIDKMILLRHAIGSNLATEIRELIIRAVMTESVTDEQRIELGNRIDTLRGGLK